jgi:hypothetical protein
VSSNLLGSTSVSPVVEASILTSRVAVSLIIPTIDAVRACSTCTSLLGSVLVPEVYVTYTCSAESIVSFFHAESDVINYVGVSLHRPSPDGVTRGHGEHVDLVVCRLVNSDNVFVISRDRHSVNSHRAFRKGEALNHFSSRGAPCENGRRRPVLTGNSNFSILGKAESQDVITMTHLLV